MTTKERLFHVLCSELIALAIIVPVASMATGKQIQSLIIVSIGLSVYFVVWNYVYNWLFDSWFGPNRESRTLLIRIIYSIGFEGGMILLTIPAIAWFLEISFIQAFLLEAGFLVFILIYTIVYNWIYDKTQPYQFVRTAVLNKN